MRMTFAHAVLLLSFKHRIGEYPVALKDFDFSCFLGYKQPITSKGKWRHVDEMNVAKGLQLHDLFLFFPLACENKHRIEKVFALIMEGIGTLWFF